MLSKSPTWFEEPEDQHLLAYKLAQSILHLQATPWLPTTWRLQSISLLDQDDFDDDGFPNALRTLRITLDVPDNAGNQQPTVTGSTPGVDESVDIYQQFGVRNIMLFNLGIALLEIEHKKPLADLKQKDQTDIIAARRLVAQPLTEVGKQYRDLARKCLDCNFGCDDSDLKSEELQRAVYSHVVRRLKKLVDNYTGSGN